MAGSRARSGGPGRLLRGVPPPRQAWRPRLHARYPFIVTWDDHEVTNDSWREGAENHQPDEGDYLERKARAHRVYDEWMPVRLGGTAETGDGTRLFRRLQWGRLGDITLLDLRSYRDEMVRTDAPFPLPQLQTEADDPDRTLTGNSVMIAPLSFAQLPREMVAAINEVTGEVPSDGVPLNTDQWDGYTADRRELSSWSAPRSRPRTSTR